ncbi:tetratricopeptide repeat protein [Thermodesulfobacteriota bacterium]
MKRIVSLFVVFSVALMLVTSLGLGQSREEGVRLLGEAIQLQEKARSNEDLQETVQKYEKALQIFEELGDKKAVSGILQGLGSVYSHWGDYKKAVELFEKSLAICRELGERRCEAQNLGNLGSVHSAWGQQHEKAVDYYEKSLAICRDLGDRKAEATVLNNLGLVYSAWGRYKKAVDFYEKSLAICRKVIEFDGLRDLNRKIELDKLGDRKGEANALSNLGNVYYAWGQYKKAVEHYETALAIRRELADRRGEGSILGNLGGVYYAWGQYKKAVDFFEKSLAICRDVGDRQDGANALNNLGLVYSVWGRYKKAVEFYEKSLVIKGELGDRGGEGKTLGNLGLVYSAWGQYKKAVELYERDLAICRELGDRKGEGSILGKLGDVYALRGEHERALKNYRTALKIYKEIGVPTGSPKNKIGMLYLRKGEIQKAEPYINDAGYTSDLGRLYLAKSDYEKAKPYYEKILKWAEKSRHSDMLFTGYTGLGAVFDGLGDDSKAEAYYTKAVRFTEELRSSLTRDQREKFFDVRINGFYRTAPYEGLARVLLRLNKPTEAWKSSEYTKARVFAEAMSRHSEGKGFDVPADILETDEEINDQLAAMKKNRQKAYEKQNKELIESLEPQIKELEKKRQAHIKMLRKKYPMYAATKYPEPMALAQTSLKDAELVLSFDVTDTGVLIYLTKGKKLVKGLFKEIPRKELDELVLKFRKPMTGVADYNFISKLMAFDFKSGKNLADILLSDVLARIPEGTPLMIVPDDSLGLIPFEMLVLNDGGKAVHEPEKDSVSVTGAKFFGDRNPISYYQSVTALTLARTHGKKGEEGKKYLVMDDPIFEAKDERLKTLAKKKGKHLPADAPDQLLSIKDELGFTFPRVPLTSELGEFVHKLNPERTDRYTGLKAAKALLFKEPLDQYGSVIFATHGYFGKDLPGIQEPVLILTLINQPEDQDGFLRMSEVMGLKLNAGTVALTACQSGLGRRVSGEGTMGMGRAFQYAGAKSVLMSLWSVAERSSVDMMESFFKHTKNGRSRLEALQLARKEIRETGYDHPFFWAPFILVGEVN